MYILIGEEVFWLYTAHQTPNLLLHPPSPTRVVECQLFRDDNGGLGKCLVPTSISSPPPSKSNNPLCYDVLQQFIHFERTWSFGVRNLALHMLFRGQYPLVFGSFLHILSRRICLTDFEIETVQSRHYSNICQLSLDTLTHCLESTRPPSTLGRTRMQLLFRPIRFRPVPPKSFTKGTT